MVETICVSLYGSGVCIEDKSIDSIEQAKNKDYWNNINKQTRLW